MEITIAGNTSAFYVRSQSILENQERFLFGMDRPGHVIRCEPNPSAGSSMSVHTWQSLPKGYPPEAETIRGTFSTNSGGEGSYELHPLPTSTDTTQSIEVNNDSYHLLPNILHHLGQQTYGLVQEYSWLGWLASCLFPFGSGEDSNQGASSSGNTGQVVTEQPHPNQQRLNEWRVRLLLTGNQARSQQVSDLDKLLSDITAQSSGNPMQLVSLMGQSTPASPIYQQSREDDILLTFRVYLPDSVTNESQARNALTLPSVQNSPAILFSVSLESSDAKNEEVTDL